MQPLITNTDVGQNVRLFEKEQDELLKSIKIKTNLAEKYEGYFNRANDTLDVLISNSFGISRHMATNYLPRIQKIHEKIKEFYQRDNEKHNFSSQIDKTTEGLYWHRTNMYEKILNTIKSNERLTREVFYDLSDTQKINSLILLREKWDYENAAAVSNTSVKNALNFVKICRNGITNINANIDGKISIDYSNKNYRVEFKIISGIDVLYRVFEYQEEDRKKKKLIQSQTKCNFSEAAEILKKYFNFDELAAKKLGREK
jgi:hypothetical protein